MPQHLTESIHGTCPKQQSVCSIPEVSLGLEALPEGKLALPDEVVDWGHPGAEP